MAEMQPAKEMIVRTFITGASSGLGRGLALNYATSGTTIGLCARRADVLADVAREIEALGARPIVYGVDVADTAAMAKSASDFVAQAGGIDLVIANAGVGIPHGILEGKSEPIAQLMRINVIGVTNTIVPFVPAMVAQHSGLLVATSSVVGHRGMPGRAAYGASKAAVISFMDALRMDLHGTGVHAMAICPGFVHTPMTAKLGRLPFAIDTDKAVALMSRAIERHDNTFTFPWQMRLLTPVLRNAPEWLLRRIAPPPRPEGS
jgi:short-subunit dehydrogenase